MTIILQTNMGNISLELDTENTPNTAQNFLNYAESGFFDGLIFHRVIKGFMVQGGGFTPDMSHKEGNDPIENEADKGGSNLVGTLAMARTSDPHSASSQFFINVEDNLFLDHQNKSMDGWGYCVFAKVVDGMDIVQKMSQVKTTDKSGHSNVPVDAIIIDKVLVEEPAE